MDQALTRIAQHRILPIVVIDKSEHASSLGDALVAGGLPVAEVTFRTAAAEESIRRLAKRGDILVGAGTILTIEQADRAIDAGAKFLVAPGTNPRVVEHASKRNIPIVPGVATPTEIESAISLGVKVLKFFPAESMGGIAAIKAFAGPFAEIRFVPTGGITPELLPAYVSLPSVIACGGSWMVPRGLLAAGRFDAIEALVKDAAGLLAEPPDIST